MLYTIIFIFETNILSDYDMCYFLA